MNKSALNHIVIAMLASVSLTSYAASKQPELTLAPLSNPVLEIPLGEEAEIKYRLTNHSHKPYALSMKPIKGITQQYDKPGTCNGQIPLESGQSCELDLLVNAQLATGIDKTGPLLCEHAWNWQDEKAIASGVCVQPEEGSRLSVRSIPAGSASFTVKIKTPQRVSRKNNNVKIKESSFFAPSFNQPPLALFVNSGLDALVEVRNNSSNIAYNLFFDGASSILPGDAFYLEQFSEVPEQPGEFVANCGLILPGKSCSFVFREGSIPDLDGLLFFDSPNTTNFIGVDAAQYDIGYTYDVGPIYKLPNVDQEPNINVEVAYPSDQPPGAMTLAQAQASCAAGDSLPLTFEELQQLYAASACSPTSPSTYAIPISGFTCSADYWADDGSAVNFATGAETFPAMARARCTSQYTIS